MTAALSPVNFRQKSTASQPRAYVKVDGKLYSLRSYHAEKNCHGATNRAEFVVSYAGNPDWTSQLFRGKSDNSPVYVEIWAGFPPNPGMTPSISGLSRRFYGILDEYDPQDMERTEFHCRSIAAPLTTDRITTAVQNMTTVDFLRKLAASYNIPVVVDPQLTNPYSLQQVYSGDFLVGLHNLIKWDVLLRSSWFDDVDVWEDDGTLYYVHPWNVAQVVGDKARTLNLTYGQDVKSFQSSHSPQFARNIRILVTSYRAKTRVSVSTRVRTVTGQLSGVAVAQVIKTSTSSPQWGTNGGSETVYYNDGTTKTSQWSSSGGGSSGSNAPIGDSGLEEYHFPVPNLTPTQCQQLALAIWRQISQHEYRGRFEIAVTPQNLPFLNIEGRINLQGYGMSLFNTLYWPRTLDETFEMADENSDTAGGWLVTSEAINHTPPLGGV